MNPHQSAIFEALPGTVKAVAEAIAKTPKSVYESLKRMHGAEAIHISGWQATVSNPAAVYSAGRGEDAPRPIPKWGAGPARGGVADLVIAVPIVAQALSQPSSIWAYAQQQGAA